MELEWTIVYYSEKVRLAGWYPGFLRKSYGTKLTRTNSLIVLLNDVSVLASLSKEIRCNGEVTYMS